MGVLTWPPVSHDDIVNQVVVQRAFRPGGFSFTTVEVALVLLSPGAIGSTAPTHPLRVEDNGG